MKSWHATTLATFVSFGLGGGAVHTLYAQAKPPVYLVSEIEPADVDIYTKEYASKAQSIIKAAGGRFLASSQTAVAIEGEAPTSRVAITIWDSTEQIQTWRGSQGFKDLQSLREKAAKFRSFAVEALPR
jgi:uncharacterized protein (DUF1330 family)